MTLVGQISLLVRNQNLNPNSQAVGEDGGVATHDSPAFETLIASNWVWSSNVNPLVETLSYWIGYAYDSSDAGAIEHGLQTSDNERDEWFSYPLVGQPALSVELAQDPNADPVSVRIWPPDTVSADLTARIEATLHIFNDYKYHR